ncbi:hypothetical protein [Kitasatospora sp. MBT66]|nr:hypothetical protein [Kitasatospora sp. MBT66]
MPAISTRYGTQPGHDQPALLQTTTAEGADQPEALDLVRTVLARTD